MTNAKVTKKDKFAMILDILAGSDHAEADMLTEFVTNEIALLDKKAAKAKERQAEKKAAGDELTDVIKSVMSKEEFEVIADIAAKVAEIVEDSTVAKVTYRLGQLVKNGEAENTDVKIPGGEGVKARTIKGYKLIG